MRRVHEAWKKALEILEAHRIRRAPVDVVKITSRYAQVVYRDLESEISGALVPLDQSGWAILVNAAHAPNRQRFTVAHELGHLLLHGYTAPHADRSFRFRDARSSEGSALEEVQANQFAAELLMPRALLLKEAYRRHLEYAPGIEGRDEEFDQWIHDAAERYQVSRQAMTIRVSSLFA